MHIRTCVKHGQRPVGWFMTPATVSTSAGRRRLNPWWRRTKAIGVTSTGRRMSASSSVGIPARDGVSDDRVVGRRKSIVEKVEWRVFRLAAGVSRPPPRHCYRRCREGRSTVDANRSKWRLIVTDRRARPLQIRRLRSAKTVRSTLLRADCSLDRRHYLSSCGVQQTSPWLLA